jgi:hypothetical protein
MRVQWVLLERDKNCPVSLRFSCITPYDVALLEAVHANFGHLCPVGRTIGRRTFTLTLSVLMLAEIRERRVSLARQPTA